MTDAVESREEATRAVAEAALASIARVIDVSAAKTGATVRVRPPGRPRAAPRTPGADDLEVLGEIGRGGMGVVERVRQRSLDREVAVKRALDPTRRESTDALYREARVGARLAHPNVVPVHALVRAEDGTPRLVMKKVEGVPWLDLCRDPEHPAWGAVRGDRMLYQLQVLIQVCRAVELCHDRGLLHRDVKLANVMLGQFGEVYLLDFGLAIEVAEAAALEPQQVEGTPSYMAPEMLDPPRGVDARADVFLLGATLHHALTGEPRHAGDSYPAVLFSAAACTPCAHGPDVPDELAAICRRATHLDKGARYESVRALREALEDFIAHRPSIELSEAADERLARLRELTDADPVDDAAVRETFRRCRFGFDSALESWSDNDAAAAGRQEALALMFAHELRVRSASGARGILAELDAPSGDAEARLAALEVELADDRAAKDQLERIRGTFDDEVGAAARVRAARVLGGLLLAACVSSAATALLGLEEYQTPRIFAVTTGAFFIAVLGAAFLYRASLFSNRFNTTMSLVVFAVSVGVLHNRVVALWLGHSVAESIATDTVLLAAVFLIAGAVLRRVFFVGTASMVLTSFAAALWPDWALVNISLAGAVTVLSLLFARGSWREPLLRLPDR